MRPPGVATFARRGRRAAAGFLLLLLFVLSGCAVGESRLVAEARRDLIGLRADDLMLCAGVPDRRASLPSGNEFWTYERDTAGGGLSVPVPVAGGAVSLAGGSACRVTFQITEGLVARMAANGAPDLPTAPDAACAPLVVACVRSVQTGVFEKPLPAGWIGATDDETVAAPAAPH